MIEPFLHLCCGFIFPIYPPLLDGFATRTSPTRSFANMIVLNSFLVESRQLSRGGERAQRPRAYSRVRSTSSCSW
jgi:hypothetical protein